MDDFRTQKWETQVASQFGLWKITIENRPDGTRVLARIRKAVRQDPALERCH